MKKSVLFAACAILCGAAFAQAPIGVVRKPSAESDPIAAGGRTAAAAQSKVDAKTGGENVMPVAGDHRAMGHMRMDASDISAMDTNGDGMISKKEWQAFHDLSWSRMKSKNGSVSRTDMESMFKGGPN